MTRNEHKKETTQRARINGWPLTTEAQMNIACVEGTEGEIEQVMDRDRSRGGMSCRCHTRDRKPC